LLSAGRFFNVCVESAQENRVSEASQNLVVRIEVKLEVGDHLMAASDDPIFLGLRGPCGRQFRLRLAKGKFLRKGKIDHFILGSPNDDRTNVEQAELNDPTVPAIDALSITSAYIRKGFEPVPNVRAMGEMDDRLLIDHAEVDVITDGVRVRFARRGPIWLGLASGLNFELPRTDADS
jgi:hypothetical protein